ncbi:MAG TPA: OB-fold domain-containing protein [Aquihabitans sp.]|nr:OB-fold domain-containing protein [Aquihabitans sp.]
MPDQIPLVDYLVLGDDPHLVANECTACGARFFDRRNACASCGGADFAKVDIDTTGEVRAFTIVSFAAPGVPVPFVAALVDCGGTSVRANLVNVEPDDAHVTLGMPVRLTTSVMGTDEAGTEAVTFGFEPVPVSAGAPA